MKSNVRDLTDYCECIIIDAYAKCTTDATNMARDLKVMRHRTGNEGLSFLTITLPAFGSEFERALECRAVTSSFFAGWRKKESLPAFLQALTRLVFDAGTGRILDEPDLAGIEGIRQIAYTFKKLSLPCTPEREYMALSGYAEVEHLLSSSMFIGDTNLFCEISDLLWGNVLYENYDSLRYIPKHGPGQTAEYISGNRKYAQRSWFERLEPFFPSDSYLMSCVSQLEDEDEGIESVQYVSAENEWPARVSLVPKTSKGPRIIAMEPVCMQYTQQALARYIIDAIERYPITSGHINFGDQQVNRRLALSASRDKSLATMDLSSASDRVPLSMVRLMLRSRPLLLEAIEACRSNAAQLPDGRIISPLAKFASMGSALCFPIEAMYFFTVILTALMGEANFPVTLRNLIEVSRNVYVYGDDIIIPVDKVDIVAETLVSYFCKVNAQKSFWKGNFRESCGMDAFNGECVTPTYLREVHPSNKGDVPQLLSWVATRNLLYKRGYWVTANYMRKRVEAILGVLPIIEDNSAALGWTSFLRRYSFDRWNRKLHRFEVHAYVACPVYKRDRLRGWSALLKFFLNAEQRTVVSLSVDEKHLDRSPRSGTSCIKRRWTTPF